MSETALLIIGFAATSLTAIASVPQVIKTIKTKDTKSVSLLMFIILTLGYAGWLTYGSLRMDLPMIIGNAVGISFQLVIIIYKIVNIAKGREKAFEGKEK